MRESTKLGRVLDILGPALYLNHVVTIVNVAWSLFRSDFYEDQIEKFKTAWSSTNHQHWFSYIAYKMYGSELCAIDNGASSVRCNWSDHILAELCEKNNWHSFNVHFLFEHTTRPHFVTWICQNWHMDFSQVVTWICQVHNCEKTIGPRSICISCSSTQQGQRDTTRGMGSGADAVWMSL